MYQSRSHPSTRLHLLHSTPYQCNKRIRRGFGGLCIDENTEGLRAEVFPGSSAQMGAQPGLEPDLQMASPGIPLPKQGQVVGKMGFLIITLCLYSSDSTTTDWFCPQFLCTEAVALTRSPMPSTSKGLLQTSSDLSLARINPQNNPHLNTLSSGSAPGSSMQSSFSCACNLFSSCPSTIALPFTY